MELGAAGLKEQPFRTHGRPLVFVGYQGQQKAFEFLAATCAHNSGMALFQGPTLSGKTTLLRQFAAEHKKICSVALVDGAHLNTTALLEQVLREYGYEYQFDSVNELLGMLKVFIRQQTVTGMPPLLIIENSHDMNPSALRVLCELAEIRIREKFALKIVLASDRPINYILRGPAMECLQKRLTGDFHLQPLIMGETNDYLYAKMRHGGCHDPERVFTEKLCDELHKASGGWPGTIDRLALLALANAKKCPIGLKWVERPAIAAPTNVHGEYAEPEVGNQSGREYPVLFLTHNGKTLEKIKFQGSRLLIGRSAHNDVTVESKFISRHHVLLVRNGESTLLMDLNSANGTYVNSWRVSNQVLQNQDVITVGEHGLKFVHIGAHDRETLEETRFDDTVVMKSMADMRRVLARESTELVPAPERPSELPQETV